MTLTVRSASVTGATTASRALTYAEMDANWAHVIQSSNQSFTPLGTGGITTETVSSALRRMCFSGQYSTTANFNTARDALTDTAAVRALQIGVSTASTNSSIAFPARTSGRGQQAIISYDATFNGTIDPNLSIGYNLAADGTAAQAGEPQLHLAFEGNYNDGSGNNKMECYIQLDGLTGQGAKQLRPWFVQANRDTATITCQHFADVHQFAGPDALTAASALDIYPTHVDFVCARGLTGNYYTVISATTGNVPVLSVTGIDAGISCGYSAKGTGGHFFYTDSATKVGFVINRIANSVNYTEVFPAAAGGTVSMRANGTDTDVNIAFTSKGAGFLRFMTNYAGNDQFRVTHTASSVNYLQVTGAATGANASIKASAENVLIGSGSALATTATAGHVMIPSCAGTPTGTPTAGGAGKIAMIYDTTADKIWFFNGTAWKGVLVA